MHLLNRGLAALCALAILAGGPAFAQPASYTIPDATNPTGERSVNVTPTTPMPTSAVFGTSASAQIGATDETAASTPSGSSGLNGLLKGFWTGLRSVIGSKAGGTAADSSLLTGCVYVSSAPTLTNGQQASIACNDRGNVKVAVTTGVLTGADGKANSSGLVQFYTPGGVAQGGLDVRPSVYNPTTGFWDSQRGDANGTVTQPHAVTGSRWQYAGATGGITDTADVALAAAGGAGVRNYLAGLQYMNSAATASEIVVKDGSTVIWRSYVPASMTQPVVISFAVPLKGTAATALNIAMLTTATATRVSAQGFTGS